MAKIIDQIRAADPELWKEIRAASLLRGGMVHEWIIDWLRFAIEAERKLGRNSITILRNQVHSSKRDQGTLL